MNDRLVRRLLVAAAASTAIAAAAVTFFGASRLAFGVLAGGLWNLTSLWCLAQLLRAWLGPKPSQRRAIGWLLVKFPFLYVGIFFLMRHPAVSLLGFGIGFTVVLVVAVGVLAFQTRQTVVARADGR